MKLLNTINNLIKRIFARKKRSTRDQYPTVNHPPQIYKKTQRNIDESQNPAGRYPQSTSSQTNYNSSQPHKIRKFILYLFITGLTIFIFTSAYTGYVYSTWLNQKDDVLSKLNLYKKQLDYLRQTSSLNTNSGYAGTVSVGAVAIPTRVFDRNNILIGEFFTERRTLIPIERIPRHITQTLVASEDRAFYDHNGISYKGIFRAFVRNILSFRFAQGGSTITQQLAKVLFTDQEKTLRRKIFEYFCTLEIEERFTKTQILEMYLNLVYMGHGNYGIESASKYYFNKNTPDIDLAETAMLIGLLPNPRNFSPINNVRLSLRRQSMVLSSLVDLELTTQKNIDYAVKKFHKKWAVNEKDGVFSSKVGDFPDRAYRINRAPFFLNSIKQILLDRFPEDIVTKGGLKVYTSLDYYKQKIASEALQTSIKKQKAYFEKKMKNASAKKKSYYKSAIQKTNGVFIAIEPKTGYVTTLIGGSEFTTENQFNRALKAYRQVGSLMKPFVFYNALKDKVITPASIVEDKPYKKGKISFKNYDYKYLGDITAYEALKRSRNTVAVRLLEKTGIKDLRKLMANLLDTDYNTINERIPAELGVALGSAEFSPLEVARAYGAFINNGYSVVPKFILTVEDSMGKMVWQPTYSEPRPVVDRDTSFVLINILKSVFEENGTAGWVSKRRKKNPDYLPFEIAGKTGTTSKYKDAWFVGLTSDEVSVVWIGTDFNTPLGSGRSGGSLCSPVWIRYIDKTRKINRPQSFFKNYDLENINYENFCTQSGGVPHDESLCTHTVRHPFLTGTEPDFFCPLHVPASQKPPIVNNPDDDHSNNNANDNGTDLTTKDTKDTKDTKKTTETNENNGVNETRETGQTNTDENSNENNTKEIKSDAKTPEVTP